MRGAPGRPVKALGGDGGSGFTSENRVSGGPPQGRVSRAIENATVFVHCRIKTSIRRALICYLRWDEWIFLGGAIFREVEVYGWAPHPYRGTPQLKVGWVPRWDPTGTPDEG